MDSAYMSFKDQQNGRTLGRSSCISIARLSPMPYHPSPSPDTDYRKKTKVNETPCFRVWRMINKERKTRPFFTFVVFSFILLLALIGLVLFFISRRSLDITLYDLTSTMLRVCNRRDGVTVSFEGLETKFSVLNLNYFPVLLTEAQLTIGLRSENKTSPFNYKFEVTQSLKRECKGKSFCTGLASIVETINFKMSWITNLEFSILRSTCRSGTLTVEVVVEAYQYMFLGHMRTVRSLGASKMFSTPCAGCSGLHNKRWLPRV